MKIKYSIFLGILILCASIGGTFATWNYAEEPSNDVQTSQDIILSEFVWEPEEILPITPGQNYLDLHYSILYNEKNGLNASKDALEKAVIKNVLLHSSDNIQGGNLKHLFINEACRELEFLLVHINDDMFYLYMYKHSDTLSGAVGVTKIQVYVAILTREGDEWVSNEAQVGYAVLGYLPDTNIISIDISTWTR